MEKRPSLVIISTNRISGLEGRRSGLERYEGEGIIGALIIGRQRGERRLFPDMNVKAMGGMFGRDRYVYTRPIRLQQTGSEGNRFSHMDRLGLLCMSSSGDGLNDQLIMEEFFVWRGNFILGS
jgi:ribosomal protein L27